MVVEVWEAEEDESEVDKSEVAEVVAMVEETVEVLVVADLAANTVVVQ